MQTLQAVVHKLHAIRPIQPTINEIHAAVFIQPDSPTLTPDAVRQALDDICLICTYQTNAPLDADVKDWFHTTEFGPTPTTHQLTILIGHVTTAARQKTCETNVIILAEYTHTCKTTTLTGVGARRESHKTSQLRIRALYHDRPTTTTAETEALDQYA